MASSREDIAASLVAYHSFIAAQNRCALEVYVLFIATAVQNDLENDEDIKKLRLDGLHTLLDTTLQDFNLSESSKVHTRYDKLAPKISLNGTYVIPRSTPSKPKATRCKYLSVIKETLEEKSRKDI
ncbi:uncharacterized protein ColSpa_11283 [Colletotrichum spaethianum]|uniref:Uncharacterized protein n=1 Tax=Colletotrichum spaethianum TaxID=700344 RepID=A0AA37PFA0_9PEZI|nr:uncharacterized protein ColSpa_11283 [Colletotrichum spaethianum]GKT51102.1 hypothetical protein ColSpa_11283 [Colletotrichum spaethianum]